MSLGAWILLFAVVLGLSATFSGSYDYQVSATDDVLVVFAEPARADACYPEATSAAASSVGRIVIY